MKAAVASLAVATGFYGLAVAQEPPPPAKSDAQMLLAIRRVLTVDHRTRIISSPPGIFPAPSGYNCCF